jgi:hypothetical protein
MFSYIFYTFNPCSVLNPYKEAISCSASSFDRRKQSILLKLDERRESIIRVFEI